MLKRRNTILCLLTALLVSAGVCAQTAQDVLTASGNAFRNNDYLSMEVSMYNYVSATAKGQLIGKGEMHKSKDSYYSKFMNDEMISNQNCTVILNHDSKEMYCFIGEKQKRRDRQAIVPPDSLSRPGDSSVLVGIENGCNHIIIYHKNSYYLRTELFISIATNLPSRIVYFYAPDTEDFAVDAYKTELVYEKISFDEPDKDIFSEEKYVEKKNGKWFTTTAFRNYKLTVSETPEQ